MEHPLYIYKASLIYMMFNIYMHKYIYICWTSLIWKAEIWKFPKSATFWSLKMLQVENSTADIMGWVVVKMHGVSHTVDSASSRKKRPSQSPSAAMFFLHMPKFPHVSTHAKGNNMIHVQAGCTNSRFSTVLYLGPRLTCITNCGFLFVCFLLILCSAV